MARALTQSFVTSALPFARPAHNPASFAVIREALPAPSRRLVDAYLEWSRGGLDHTARHTEELPPHMVSHWALPLVTRVLLQARYPLARALNQGVRVSVHEPLDRGCRLEVTASLASLEESDGRVRASIDVQTRAERGPGAVDSTFHIVYLLGKGRSSSKAPPTREEPEVRWQRAGTFSVAARDGLRFALVSGDFNPIHWVPLAGKLSPFGQLVLQGFGTFARTWECLRAHVPLTDVDVRFVRPVPMPSSDISVEYTDDGADGRQRIRACLPSGAVALAGTIAL
jgi:acyl dehydratase